MNALLLIGTVVGHFWYGIEDCWLGAVKAVQLFQKSPLARRRFRELFILNGLLIFCADLVFQVCSEPAVRYLLGSLFRLFDFMADLLRLPSPQLAAWITSNSVYMANTMVVGLRMLWVIPVFLLTKPVNVFWYQDIANEAYRESGIKSKSAINFVNMSRVISSIMTDFVYSVVLSIFFMMQTGLVLYFIQTWFSLYVGSAVYFVHQALLSALFSCEYGWYSRGIFLGKRITIVENNWPYYMGFGASLAFLTLANLSVMASSALYAAVFPLCIVGGTLTQRKVNCGAGRFPIFIVALWCCRQIFERKSKKKAVSRQPADRTVPSENDEAVDR